MNNTTETNRITATRFIEGFNTDDWDAVREAVAVTKRSQKSGVGYWPGGLPDLCSLQTCP